MKTEIKALNDYIESLDIIKSFGGLCVNMQDKELPYGVDGSGKVYTTDTYLGVLGYTFIESIRNHEKNGFNVVIGFNIFVSPKSIGELLPVYELPMFLYQKLKTKYRDITFVNINTKKYSHYELSTIYIKIQVYSICDELELKKALC